MATYEEILQRILKRIPETQDTRESTITYQIIAACAAEFKNAYDKDEETNEQTYADTADYDRLVLRAAERGIAPTEASAAILKGVFNINVDIGERFFYKDFTYVVTEKIADCQYKLTCEQAGADANSYIGKIVPIQDIEGLESAEITEVLIYGENEEEYEDFRNDYFDTFNNRSYGWNKAMYKKYVNELQGVGGVIVLPHTNEDMETEGGHVALVIESSEYGVPSQSELEFVKNTLDPSDGDGEGIVSIDHNVHCFACGSTSVNVSATITYASGFDFNTLKEDINNAIDEYFLELNKKWEDESIIVRVSYLESRLIALNGIIDIANTKLNGSATNLEIERYSIVKRGVVSG